ncbi:MAG: hypothetical protein HOE26_02305 [Rhodospirillaceae bacterium]|nr:hypothetical protein [Rhodospirillaceae bacterium]
MIISCPNCATTYNIDAGAVGNDGKAVRCSSCSHQWLQKPVSDTRPQPMQLQPSMMAPPPPPVAFGPE